MDAFAVEYIAVHDHSYRGAPRQRLRLLGGDSETNRTRAISPSPAWPASRPASFERICRIVSIMARIASGRISGWFCLPIHQTPTPLRNTIFTVPTTTLVVWNENRRR